MGRIPISLTLTTVASLGNVFRPLLLQALFASVGRVAVASLQRDGPLAT